MSFSCSTNPGLFGEGQIEPIDNGTYCNIYSKYAGFSVKMQLPLKMNVKILFSYDLWEVSKDLIWHADIKNTNILLVCTHIPLIQLIFEKLWIRN